ncbi:MAG: hypothetical protein ACXACB_15770, partial [Promethearchaeota archaeon]
MTEAYPLLTVENVKYWYWEVEPHWSGGDIGRAIGCSSQSVTRFMHKNNIPVRSISEANLNRFNCPQKYQKFLKQRTSSEFREQQSILNIEAWQDPHKRRNFVKGIRQSSANRLSDLQKVLLFLIIERGNLFLTDFISITNLRRRQLDSVLRELYARNCVERTKEYNKNTRNQYKFHYKYSIAKKGRDLFNLHLTSCSFKYEEELEKIHRRLHNIKAKEKARKPCNVDEKTPLGKNQKIILEIFQRKNHPLFLMDLLPLTAIPIKSVDSSLKRLVERGFLSRKE